MELDFIRNHITEPRLKKGVSEYKVSQDLGHSRNDIQGITSGRCLPSGSELFLSADILGLNPPFSSIKRKKNAFLFKKSSGGYAQSI